MIFLENYRGNNSKVRFKGDIKIFFILSGDILIRGYTDFFEDLRGEKAARGNFHFKGGD